MTPDEIEDITYELNRELAQDEQREINRRVEHARAARHPLPPDREEHPVSTETPARCPRCEHPHGTCHHTAPPIVVGDVIDEATMSTGRAVRLGELRSNSRLRDPDGDTWVKTRRRDGAWESQHGDIAHLHQIAWPLVVEHVAGRRK